MAASRVKIHPPYVTTAFRAAVETVVRDSVDTAPQITNPTMSAPATPNVILSMR